MSSGYFDKSKSNTNSFSPVSGSIRSLPPKKRRFVHFAGESKGCFDNAFSPPKRVCKPTIDVAANSIEAFEQHKADALSSLFENCRSAVAMEAGDLQVSLGRCATTPSQVIRNNNAAGSSKQQYQNLHYSVVIGICPPATSPQEQLQLQSSRAVAQLSPGVAAKVALLNAYLKAQAQVLAKKAKSS